MEPTLAAGDFVLASRWLYYLSIGDYIVVEHPKYQRIIKRIVTICPKQGLWLSGDNPKSLTSEQMGWLDKRCVVAKVIKQIKRK